MICLCIPPLSSWQDLCHNLSILPPLLLDFLCDLLCNLLLLRVVVENTTPVLGSSIWTLSILRCRIVHLVQKLNQRRIADLLWIEHDLQSFRVASLSRADAAVRRVGGVTADVADARIEQALVGEGLAVHVL